MTVTWNPSDKAAGLALSNGNLTATNGAIATFGGVRATLGKTGGRTYWEVTAGSSSGTDAIGFGDQSESLSALLGVDTHGYGVQPAGIVVGNNATVATVAAWTSGDVVSIALDMVNLRAWFRTNAGNWNNSGTANPSTNVGGIDVSAISTFFPMYTAFVLNSTVTANFGATAFAQAIPSGFGPFSLIAQTPQRLWQPTMVGV